MRKKMTTKNIAFPTGYPYILFKVGKGKKYKYTLAATENQALRDSAMAKARVFPITVSDTIKLLGHKKTNKLFSKFGDSWMTKEGHVFFKELKHET